MEDLGFVLLLMFGHTIAYFSLFWLWVWWIKKRTEKACPPEIRDTEAETDF